MPGIDVQRTLRDYVRILFRRRWLFLVAFVVALAVAGWRFIETPKKYRVRAVVKREDPVLLKELGRAGRAERGAENRGSASARLTQRPELIRILSASTYKIEYDNRKELGLGIRKPGSPLDVWLGKGDWTSPVTQETKRQWEHLYGHPDWSKILSQVIGSIDVRVRSQRGGAVQHIAISYTDKDPELARKVCTALYKTYIMRSETGIKRRLDDTIKTLEGQLKTLVEKQLDPTRKELEDFEKEHLGKMPKYTAALDAELKQRTAMVQTIVAHMKAAMNDIARLNEGLEKTPKVIVTERDHTLNPDVQQIQSEIRQLRSDLRRLRLTYTEEHPEIQKVKTLIKEAEHEMTRLPEEIEEGRREGPNPQWQWFKQQLDERIRQLAELQDRFAASKQELDRLETQKTTILQLYREFMDLKEGFTKLTDARQALKDDIAKNERDRRAHIMNQGIRFEVVEEPVKPRVPTDPDPLIYLVVGLLGGVAAGTGLIVLAEHTDHSLRTVSDAARVLRVPVVGTIGLIRGRTRRRLHVLLRVTRWTLLIGAPLAVLGLLVLVWQNSGPKEWGEPYWRHTRNLWREPRATIHRWTGAHANRPPSVGGLDIVQEIESGTVTLIARDVGDVDGVVEEVRFYRDTNGDDTLDVSRDEYLGNDTSNAEGWNWTGSTSGWSSGTVVCFAEARDNRNLPSQWVSARLVR